MAGKTITTYLIDGNPKGIKTVFISNKLCQALFIPRAKLAEALTRQELQQPSLYFLLSNSEEKIYVGETEKFSDRIKNHHSNKDFWDTVLVFVSRDNYLTKADVKYLEHLALNIAQDTARYNLDENSNHPQAPNLPEHQSATVEEFFEDVKFLTAFLGYPIFDKIETKNKQLFSCNMRGADAKGFYDENGFTILKGAKIPIKEVPSFLNPEKRNVLISSSCKKLNETYCLLEKNLTFKSPSGASGFCAGARVNGWLDWKDCNGKTLSEIFRSKLEN